MTLDLWRSIVNPVWGDIQVASEKQDVLKERVNELVINLDKESDDDTTPMDQEELCAECGAHPLN